MLIFSFMLIPGAQAQVVSKVKGNAVLIDLQGNAVQAGSEWLTVNDTGRKTGWIKITQVKGEKALGTVLKGIVATGQTLVPRPASKNRFASDPDAGVTSSKQKRAGLIIHYAQDSMTFSGGGVSATFSGTAIPILAFYDWKFTKSLFARLYAGLEPFNGSGSGYNIAVSGYGLGGDFDFSFSQSKSMQFYAGIGAGTIISSTTTNLTVLNSPSYINAISPLFGANFTINKSFFIPAEFHYDYFLAGSGITQSAIRIGAGFGMFF